MRTFNIIKKNRKYFAAKLEGKYLCKILIDENSEGLELGEQTLEVDDISVRSKYGTDLIFKLAAPVDEIKSAGICTLKTPFYNGTLVDECHKLGGKWDADERAWIFSGIVADKVEELDEKYNSPLINVEVKFTDEISEWHGPVSIAGFKIASATGRDSGAKLADGIAVIEGGATSGGSVKNWSTKVRAGTVIRMQIPELCIDDIEHDVTVKNLDTGEILAGHSEPETEQVDEPIAVSDDKKLIDAAVEKLGRDRVYDILDGNYGGHANQHAANRTIETGHFFDDDYRQAIKKVISEQ